MSELKQVLYIASVGYSGSTLLSLLLSKSLEVASVGEVYIISKFDKNNWPCTCGKSLSECGFWNPVLQEIRRQTGAESLEYSQFPLTIESKVQNLARRIPSFADFLLVVGNRLLWNKLSSFTEKSREYARCAQRYETLYRAVAKVHSSPVVLDTSKYALPLKSLYLLMDKRMKILFLTRDGRAVTSSLMRRQGMSAYEAARRWARYNWNLRLILKSVPSTQIMYLKYEDLCANPRQLIESITEFSGEISLPSRFDLNKEDAHDIGGNPMRNRKEETEIKYDDSWTEKMSRDDLLDFERAAGRCNRDLGYF